MSESARRWPLIVRVARPSDREAVLAFSTTTWNGWDYMPHAWDRWLEERDGVMLVGAVGRSGGTDADGEPIAAGTVVAVVRVALPAATEAWLEGIRVDPRVRGMDVATDLQVGELHWAAANGATIVRYATSSQNLGSHRLGARGGFEHLVALRGVTWDEKNDRPQPDHGRSAFRPEVQAEAQQRRRRVLEGFANDGYVATEADADRLWQLISGDATFNAMHRLYEPRPWALEELTEQKFVDHVRLGEVAHVRDDGGGEAVLVLVGDVLPAEDEQLRLAVLAGAPGAAFDMVERARGLGGDGIRFRVPNGASLVDEVRERYVDAGYDFSEFELHILARPIDAAHPLPAVDPAAIALEDLPQAVIRPPR